jgi:hypothetical protein
VNLVYIAAQPISTSHLGDIQEAMITIRVPLICGRLRSGKGVLDPATRTVNPGMGLIDPVCQDKILAANWLNDYVLSALG